MPIVLTYRGYKIYFYSNEGLPLEPVHVHIDKAGKTAKVWLNPISVAYVYGFSSKEIKEICNYLQKYEHFIVEVWNDFFNISDSH
ncbi:hypothetical protein CFY87_00345 [Actinobacillus seminis]|uniref:DUF4160 domain-containing protein n=1 Tax=Actinobacillus seminis TaxID=722 RepID=A0A263HFG2_9PAST|nr:DUF4160 domain-containing protein [Actinobacillus seminis]OZN25708.1 hypothetical protein CFY87_00345 [Actinobacillus seminis]SUU36965.1 Uncharacterised protein [Actinobacillus seminis]